MKSKRAEKISIIIPLYNAEAYIAETVQSVLKQTFSDFWLYIIDDFSTDGGGKIAKKLAVEHPDKIHYLKMPKKGGCPAPTKNQGVRLAKGEYIAFLDHDDWWEPTKLAKQAAYLDTHPQVNLLGCNVAVMDTDRQKTLGIFWSHPEDLIDADYRRLALEGPIFASSTCMIGRADFLRQHPFDEAYIGADEYDLSLHAALDNPAQVAILPEVLAYWRWHATSLSHSPQAAERSAKDEEYFAAKLLKRSDLSETERQAVQERLWLVRRRAANTLLAEGKRAAAQQLYQEILAHSQHPGRAVRVISLLDRLVPPLARLIVTTKKHYSYAKPIFR